MFINIVEQAQERLVGDRSIEIMQAEYHKHKRMKKNEQSLIIGPRDSIKNININIPVM